jgi:hypothetical protein
LTERILFCAGAIHQAGEVHDRNPRWTSIRSSNARASPLRRRRFSAPERQNPNSDWLSHSGRKAPHQHHRYPQATRTSPRKSSARCAEYSMAPARFELCQRKSPPRRS